eukprot:TRINITY_DN6089_c0_g1_i1.p1 TRINITY_DN6089_c0_g1~~TRINITY_DN6089_c0_g1_i1.p1  ORF type:complete len:489 (+),score=88.45 TRINITY_DN6089_c0_g1_i1:31-1497(+)
MTGQHRPLLILSTPFIRVSTSAAVLSRSVSVLCQQQQQRQQGHCFWRHRHLHVNMQQAPVVVPASARFTVHTPRVTATTTSPTRHQHTAGRTGTLQATATATGTPLRTPTWTLPTHKGSMANLSPDLTQHLAAPAALQVNVADFIEATSVITKFGEGFRTFVGQLATQPLYLAVHDDKSPHENTCPKDFVPVQTSSGRAKLTPEMYMQHVKAIEPDFFSCISPVCGAHASNKQIRKVVEITLKWLDHAVLYKQSHAIPGMLFGVIQGGASEQMRIVSAKETAKRPVEGFVLGGFHQGETPGERSKLIASVLELIPPEAPRLMTTAGTPEHVIECIDAGVDIISTAYPDVLTDLGCALILPINNLGTADTHPHSNTHTDTDKVKMNLRDKRYARDATPVLAGCSCYACLHHTRAYIHHLLCTHEMLASVLLSMHNNYQYALLFETARNHLASDSYATWRAALLNYIQTPAPTHNTDTQQQLTTCAGMAD